MIAARFFLGLLCLSAVASLCSAHICMWQPRQRGALHIDMPGDDSCVHKGPDPCGSVAAGAPVATYTAGEVATVEFQQNLNHFYGPNPGSLVVQVATVANPVEGDFTYLFGEIVDFNAMDEVNWANFSLTNTMPTTPCNPCVLRLVYNSQNPGENTSSSTAFFQCSDIIIEPAATPFDPMEVLEQERKQQEMKIQHEMRQYEATRKHSSKPNAAAPCTAPAQFETYFVSASTYGPHAGEGFMSYDAKNQLIVYRMDNPVTNAIEQHFINFTSGIEWRFTGGATCGEYGVDEWNDWSYGPSQNEEYTATISIGETQVNLWAVMDANYTYGADATSCLPVVRVFQQDIESTFYYDTSLGIANPNTFIPPSQCHTTKSWRMIQQGAGVEEIREYSRTLRRAPAGAAGKAHASACKGEKTHTKVHGKKHHKHAKLSKAADAQFSEARAALRAHFH